MVACRGACETWVMGDEAVAMAGSATGGGRGGGGGDDDDEQDKGGALAARVLVFGGAKQPHMGGITLICGG